MTMLLEQKKNMSVYNKTFPIIKQGKSLMHLNVYNKTRDLVATTESQILMIPNLEVVADIVQLAKPIIDQLTIQSRWKTKQN